MGGLAIPYLLAAIHECLTGSRITAPCFDKLLELLFDESVNASQMVNIDDYCSPSIVPFLPHFTVRDFRADKATDGGRAETPCNGICKVLPLHLFFVYLADKVFVHIDYPLSAERCKNLILLFLRDRLHDRHPGFDILNVTAKDSLHTEILGRDFKRLNEIGIYRRMVGAFIENIGIRSGGISKVCTPGERICIHSGIRVFSDKRTYG